MIAKRDIAIGEELPVTKLTLEIDGVPVENWISTNQPHSIIDLEDGTYTLIEVTAPEGYEIAKSSSFIVNDGIVSGGEVVMYDEPSSKTIAISKKIL